MFGRILDECLEYRVYTRLKFTLALEGLGGVSHYIVQYQLGWLYIYLLEHASVVFMEVVVAGDGALGMTMNDCCKYSFFISILREVCTEVANVEISSNPPPIDRVAKS